MRNAGCGRRRFLLRSEKWGPYVLGMIAGMEKRDAGVMVWTILSNRRKGLMKRWNDEYERLLAREQDAETERPSRDERTIRLDALETLLRNLSVSISVDLSKIKGVPENPANHSTCDHL